MGWASSPGIRRTRVAKSLTLLTAAIQDWQDESRPADDVRRHQAPLSLLGGVLRSFLARVEAQLPRAPYDDTVFARCQVLEGQIALAERYWRFFRDRLDQRKDSGRARVLAAADEIAWSCFSCLGGSDPTAVPLPFVDSAPSPEASPRSKGLGMRSTDSVLAQLLSRLPIALVAIPSSMMSSPWWLVLLAHEVGHHIQYDLEPDQALVGKTGDALTTATGGGERWARWRTEVFADACSVIACGTSAIYAIAELDWDAPAAMCAERGPYPPTVVRLALLCEIARQLELAPPAIELDRWRTAPLAPAVVARISDDLANVPPAATALLDLQLGSKTLRQRFDKTAFGATGLQAARARLDGQSVALAPGRNAARLTAAAAFDLYIATPDRDPEELATNMLALVDETKDGTTRSIKNLEAHIATCAAMFETIARTVEVEA